MKKFGRQPQLSCRDFFFGRLAFGLFLALSVLTLAAPGDLHAVFGSENAVVRSDAKDQMNLLEPSASCNDRWRPGAPVNGVGGLRGCHCCRWRR